MASWCAVTAPRRILCSFFDFYYFAAARRSGLGNSRGVADGSRGDAVRHNLLFSIFRRGAILAVIALMFAVEAKAILIDTVPVGNAGNGNDPATGSVYGGVAYNYSVGKL